MATSLSSTRTTKFLVRSFMGLLRNAFLTRVDLAETADAARFHGDMRQVRDTRPLSDVGHCPTNRQGPCRALKRVGRVDHATTSVGVDDALARCSLATKPFRLVGLVSR